MAESSATRNAGHPIWAALKTVEELVSKLRTEQQADQATQEVLERIYAIVDEVAARLPLTQFSLLHSSTLQGFQSWLSSLASNLQAWIGNRHPQYLNAAVAQADGMAGSLHALAPRTTPELAGFGRELRRLQAELLAQSQAHTKTVQELQKTAVDAKAELERLRSQVLQEKDAMTSLRGQFRQEFDSETKKRVEAAARAALDAEQAQSA